MVVFVVVMGTLLVAGLGFTAKVVLDVHRLHKSKQAVFDGSPESGGPATVYFGIAGSNIIQH